MGRKALNLSGKRFGDLEVIERSGSSPRGATLWRCMCHACGNEIIVEGYRLTDKKRTKTDCGCKYKEKTADLSGKTFGSICVIQRMGSKGRDAAYLCRCKICGDEKIFPASTIRIGLKSCGCQQYNSERMREMSIKGTEAQVVDGVHIPAIERTLPNRNNKLGLRGVCRTSRGNYRACCQVHGEIWIAFFSTPDKAKKARDEKQKELCEKYGIVVKK